MNAQRTGRIIMHAAGTDYCGNDDPPGAHLRLAVTDGEGVERIYATGNDGYELWMGYPDKWALHMSRSEALRLAWFVVWTWRIKGEWFGLRRWAYYQGLRLALHWREGK